MYVLFMIMYGVTLMQIENKGKVSFCAFKRPIIFFSSLRLMRNRSNEGRRRKKKNSVSDVWWTGLLRVLVCLRLRALKLWASLAELLTTNHSFILSPRGCQRAFTVLVVKFEPSPNPHHEHTGHKIVSNP